MLYFEQPFICSLCVAFLALFGLLNLLVLLVISVPGDVAPQLPLPVAIDPKCKDIYSEGMLDLKVFLTSHYSSFMELR